VTSGATPPEGGRRNGGDTPSTDTAAFDQLLMRAASSSNGGQDGGFVRTAPVDDQRPTSAGAPLTRRQLREREARGRAEQEPRDEPAEPESHHEFAWLHATAPDAGSGRGGGRASRGGKPPKEPKGRGRRAVTALISTLVIVGLVGGGALFAWNTFQPQVKSALKLFDHQDAPDYKGDGTGTVDVKISEGDTGESIAATLTKAGVTKSSQAFYQLLLATKPDPVFQPGVYQLHKHMSAASALALLQDKKSHLERTLLIREGAREDTILKDAAAATGIPVAQLQAAAKTPAAYGLPAQAKTLEGFLFPATYSFDPGVTAQQVITTLVNRAKDSFASAGIPADKLWNTVILASIVQREAGANPDDLPKIAGVFVNRIAQGMPLQSDATVHYGLNKYDTVWTTDAQRADASNAYNTYAHTGLPPGPIGSPGDAALAAAAHPQGDYLYFTVVNLKTGQTAFAKTNDEQNANVQKLQQWCHQPGNASYCK
jgi:UPF0755 protein